MLPLDKSTAEKCVRSPLHSVKKESKNTSGIVYVSVPVDGDERWLENRHQEIERVPVKEQFANFDSKV